MWMHARRAIGASLRPRRFPDDLEASMVAAVLPLLLATMGLTFLAVGAVLSIVPLLILGAGLAVVGCAVFAMAWGLDRKADSRARRRRESVRARKAEAERAFAAEQGDLAVVPRSPLADDAVAALTGTAKGGIWPPLPSGGALQAKPVPMWAPGAKVATPAFDDGALVEFDAVGTEAARAVTVTAGPGGSLYETAPARVTEAEFEAPAEERDLRVWPGARDVDRWATFTGERRPRAARYSDEQLRQAMDARRQAIAGKLPTIGAILADVDGRERGDAELEALRREATRGKCSQCAAILWAPKKRPMVLKCPQCGHKAKLY